ncbi:MAG: hypothetical protein GX263_03745 [Firmicutes bacterium]|nr:hypothetical protein [Bacillota bacterium]
MEKLGVPSVLLVARGFEHDVESGSYDNGMTMLRRVILKGYYWYIPSEESRPIAESHFNDIIDALVRPLTPDEEDPPQLEKVDLPPITITSCCYEHAIQEFQEIFDKNHWGDGLALIPPTREAVDLMLTGTTRPPDEVIGKVPIKNGEATVEKIAINAVMAGAKPEYLPVIIAAMEAVSGWGTLEDYDLIHPQGSLGGFQLAIWVSGPMGEKLNMNSKDRIWTYGNRANSTIGRAIRLCLINFGHMWPGINDMARSRVYPFTFFTFAEDFSSSPWEPYHVTYGFDAEESCITVSTISGNMPVNYTNTALYEESGQHLTAQLTLEKIIDSIRSKRSTVIAGYNPDIASPAAHPPKYIFMITPEMAEDFKALGYTQESLRKYIFEETRIPFEELSTEEIANIKARIQQSLEGKGILADQIPPDYLPMWQESLQPGGKVPILISPKTLHFVVAGGEGKTVTGWSYFDHCYTWSSHETRLIDDAGDPGDPGCG